MTANRRYFTYDKVVGPWYRGCAWQVGFYNASSKKELLIHAALPAFNTKDNPSKLHPDPALRNSSAARSTSFVRSTMVMVGWTLSVTPVAPVRRVLLATE